MARKIPEFFPSSEVEIALWNDSIYQEVGGAPVDEVVQWRRAVVEWPADETSDGDLRPPQLHDPRMPK